MLNYKSKSQKLLFNIKYLQKLFIIHMNIIINVNFLKLIIGRAGIAFPQKIGKAIARQAFGTRFLRVGAPYRTRQLLKELKQSLNPSRKQPT